MVIFNMAAQAALNPYPSPTPSSSRGPSGGRAGNNVVSAGGIVVFGGGTATNSLVDVFERIRTTSSPASATQRQRALSYVIPISDNGGSSSELIRVFGGPGIGDVRSRLVRLIPSSSPGDDGREEELSALRVLFNHRLSKNPAVARSEWLDVVEGGGSATHLWHGIGSEKRELIRAIFNLVNMEIVKRARPSSTFNFAKASIGNLFLTGARVFTGSLESGIYLLSTICSIPPDVSALPAINSNFTHHISAGLADGSVITGQNSISHPSAPTALPDDPLSPQLSVPSVDASNLASGATTPLADTRNPPQKPRHHDEVAAHDRIEDATLPGSLPTLRKRYLDFNKAADEDLPARIERIWYINPYGHEIWPVANPKVVRAVRRADAVIYSIGSLYTSLVPSLVLRGVGAAIAGDADPDHDPSAGGVGTAVANGQGLGPRHKILILNSSLDRETGPSTDPYSAVDFVRAIVKACTSAETSDAFAQPAATPGMDMDDQTPDLDAVEARIVRKYVTHIIYLEDPNDDQNLVPKVNREALAQMGVDCIRVYGRRQRQGQGHGGGMMLYDEAALAGALEAVMAVVHRML